MHVIGVAVEVVIFFALEMMYFLGLGPCFTNSLFSVVVEDKVSNTYSVACPMSRF